MIRRTSSLIMASMVFYYMGILGMMMYVYHNPIIIEEIGIFEVYSRIITIINFCLIFIVFLASFMMALTNTMKYFLGSTFLYITYQIICYILTTYLIRKVALGQSEKDILYFVMVPVILYMVFILFIKFVSRILYGKDIYTEIKLLDKKASWKRFEKNGASGFIATNIFADLSCVYACGYIEASCSSIIFPDYYYKRFSLDKEGYEAAYNWIIEKGKYMQMNRIIPVNEYEDIKSSFPQKYEWNQENSKNEPCLFKIEVD